MTRSVEADYEHFSSFFLKENKQLFQAIKFEKENSSTASASPARRTADVAAKALGSGPSEKGLDLTMPSVATDKVDDDSNRAFPHLEYDFLLPEKIRDADGRRPGQDGFRSDTLKARSIKILFFTHSNAWIFTHRSQPRSWISRPPPTASGGRSKVSTFSLPAARLPRHDALASRPASGHGSVLQDGQVLRAVPHGRRAGRQGVRAGLHEEGLRPLRLSGGGVSPVRADIKKNTVENSNFFPPTRFANLLIDKGLKVARIEQVETPKMMEERVRLAAIFLGGFFPRR